MRTAFGTINTLVCCALVAACSAASDESSSDTSAVADSTEETIPVEQADPAALGRNEDIRRYLLQQYADAGEISYALAWSDLDGDGAEEAIIYLGGPYFCGTGGCNLLVLTQAGPMWRSVGDVSVSRTPVRVLNTETNGWRDLTVEVSGGGATPATALLNFDGESYPENASVAPEADASSAGTEVLAEEPDFITAQPVAPS